MDNEKREILEKRPPGNWMYECGHQRMRPSTGEILPDPCEYTHADTKSDHRYCDQCGEHLGRSEEKLAELQKAETWDDVYKELKLRVTMESVHGEKTKISETACLEVTEAIKNMLKKEFGERWGHYVSSTRRFIVN